MSEGVKKLNWIDLIEQFSSYHGDKKEFCKENNIKVHQLNYQIGKLKKESKPTFQAIDLNSANSPGAGTVLYSYPEQREIRIELGISKIFIPANEIAVISEQIKELSKSC